MMSRPYGDGLQVMGGSGWSGGRKIWYNTILEWRPGDPSWRVAGRISTPRAYGALVGDATTRTLLIGGHHEDHIPPSSLMAADGDSPSVSDLPHPAFMAAAAGADGVWYVVARFEAAPKGLTGGGFFRYHDGTFESLPDPSSPSWILPAIVAAPGRVMLLGGARRTKRGEVVNSDEILIFEATSRNWRRVGRLPLKLRGVAAWVLNHRTVYCAGGYGGESVGGFSRRAFYVDLTSGRCAEAPPLPFPAMTHFRGSDGWLYQIGGEDDHRHRSPAVHRIAIATLIADCAGIFP